jgi:hypothetical protein
MILDAMDALASHNSSTQDEARGEQLRRQLRLRGVAAERGARQSATVRRSVVEFECCEAIRSFMVAGGLTGAARKHTASIMRICIVGSLSAAGLLPP